MASELGERVRYDAVGAAGRGLGTGRVRVMLADGELIEAEAVVCAIPAGPLREIEIAGVSDARLRSLGAQRQALAAKVVTAYDEPFWQENGPERAGRDRVAVRLDLAARAGACCRCWSRPSVSRRSWPLRRRSAPRR